MHEENVKIIMEALRPTDVVVDIGGWARPFNRANFVIDAEPYVTRGYYGAGRPAQGGQAELFAENTWIRRDICDHTPFPFADKSVDFVICSHVLEDIRDPIWVCAEMRRIAKRGYIEVPSRRAESSRGVEPSQVGWTHHRWLINIRDNHVDFLMKYHMIHSHWRFSLTASFLRSLREEEKVQWIFWNNHFTFNERSIHGVDQIARELEDFVQSVRPYSTLRLATSRGARSAKGLASRAVAKLKRS